MTRTKLFVGCAALAAGLSANAEVLDGTKPILCAAITAIVCDYQNDCVKGSPESINLPVFWRVDANKATVDSKRGGVERSSKVSNAVIEGTHVSVQGVEGGLAWSMSINKETGRMTLSGSGDEGYVVFGACEAI